MFKCFTIYGRGGRVGHVTHLNTVLFPQALKAYFKFGYNRRNDFRGKVV